MEDIITLRRDLHANPELSGAEQNTARRIAAVFQKLHPDQTITNLAGTGIAFVFDSRQPGPSILFRCELDAIAVHEGKDLHTGPRIPDVPTTAAMMATWPL